MTDVRALTDAFAELERRADDAFAGPLPELPLRVRPSRAQRPGFRLAALAATAVAGLAVGAVLLSPGDSAPGTQTGTSTTGPRRTEPRSVEELAERFRTVLGDTATFVVDPDTRSTGDTISGTLTASGVTGGFDLWIVPDVRKGNVSCEDTDSARCTFTRLPDGSAMSVARVPLQGPSGGMSYDVHLARADGFEIRMYVSNQRSPKGASEVLAPNPPLTTDQMVKIVTSDRW